MKILGVDPGSFATGFGIIEKKGQSLKYVASGCIKPKASAAFSKRLHHVYEKIIEIIDLHSPDTLVLEDVFVDHNPRSTIKLGQIRGAIILAAEVKGLILAEYPPANVKQALVGYGRAEKSQVSQMVSLILSIDKLTSNDESDALAAAICHGNTTRENK